MFTAGLRHVYCWFKGVHACELMRSFDKKDDVADAIILARYWDYKERGETWSGPNMALREPVKKSKKRKLAPARRPAKKKK